MFEGLFQVAMARYTAHWLPQVCTQSDIRCAKPWPQICAEQTGDKGRTWADVAVLLTLCTDCVQPNRLELHQRTDGETFKGPPTTPHMPVHSPQLTPTVGRVWQPGSMPVCTGQSNDDEGWHLRAEIRRLERPYPTRLYTDNTLSIPPEINALHIGIPSSSMSRFLAYINTELPAHGTFFYLDVITRFVFSHLLYFLCDLP